MKNGHSEEHLVQSAKKLDYCATPEYAREFGMDQGMDGLREKLESGCEEEEKVTR